MILENCSERFHYMSGAFEEVCKNPEKYKKADLIRAFKALGRCFDVPYKPLDSESIWRF